MKNMKKNGANKITKVNDILINYRGFYFTTHRGHTFNGVAKSWDYSGVSKGMKIHAWSREELKRKVDRRINNAIDVYLEHTGMGKDEHRNLQAWLETPPYKRNSRGKVIAS